MLEVRELLTTAAQVQERTSAAFRHRVGHSPSTGDQIKKVIEELGELAKAEKGQGNFLEEVVDSIVAMAGVAFVAGYSPEQIHSATIAVLTKLRKRHNL